MAENALIYETMILEFGAVFASFWKKFTVLKDSLLLVHA